MNPYRWAFSNPELIPLYLAFALALFGWVYWSFRKLFSWGNSIEATLSERWGRGSPIPPDDISGDILLFCLVASINLILIGGYIYVVT